MIFVAMPQIELAGTSWLVRGYNNGREAVVSVLEDTELTMEFAADSTVAGAAGCNRFTGAFETVAQTVSFGPLATTRMMCMGEGVVEQEDAFLAALGTVDTWEIRGERAQLRTAGGALAVDLVSAITGSVFIRTRQALPEDAVLNVQLQDVSRADVAAIVLGESERPLSRTPRGSSTPPRRCIRCSRGTAGNSVWSWSWRTQVGDAGLMDTPWRQWYRDTRSADGVVLFVALFVRVWLLVDSMDAPTFYYPVVDAATYDLAARSLVDGNGLDWRFFWQPFLYPVSLAGIYAVTGGSILAAKIVQLLVGVATCWLVLRVARRLFGPGTGVIAGIACAMHGPMMFFEGELLATGWATFWAILLLDRFTLARLDDPPRAWALTGALCALAVLTRPTFLPAVALATVVVLWKARGGMLVMRGGTLIGVFFLLTIPVAMLGSVTASHPSFLPASGAMNLYLGNHHEPCETLTIRPGEGWKELVGRARPAGEGDLVANRAFFREQLEQNLADHPGAIVSGIGRKLVQVFSSRELPRNVDPYGQNEWSRSLSDLMFRLGGFGVPMGFIIPFAFVGAWTARRRIPRVFYVFVGIYLLAVVAVFVSARYRMPVVPALCILAAAGLVSFVEAIRARQVRAVFVTSSTFILVALLASLPGPFCEEEIDYRAETLYAVAYAQHNKGEREKAAVTYQQALAQRPDYVELINQYALLMSQQGRSEEAIRLWTRAARLEPGNLTVRLNLGRAFAIQERHAEALEHYEAALGIQASNADALLGAGFALLGVARFEEGVDHLERAIRRNRAFAGRMPVVIDGLRSVGRGDLAARLEAEVRRAGGPR
jgi:heat shock protein HslJ/4-amino-4-deoxy-L-arabinose transferase-like glycosyltransferase